MPRPVDCGGALRLMLRLLKDEHSRIRRIGGVAADDFEKLIRWGFVTEDNLLHATICDECGESETALVEIRGGRAGILCGVQGFVERDPQSLAAFRLERDRFAQALRDALMEGATVNPPFRKISDRLWRLGGFSWGGASGAAFLAARLRGAEDFAALDSAIQSVPRPRLGAVFTASDEPAPGLRLSQDYRFIPCAAAFRLTETGLKLEGAAFAQAFPEVCNSASQPKAQGRPTLIKGTAQAIRLLQERGCWPDGVNQRVRAVQEIWLGVNPDLDPPSASTLKEHLKKLAV